MKADFLELVRLLNIEPDEIPFKFVKGKPLIDRYLFDFKDCLLIMMEKIMTIWPTLGIIDKNRVVETSRSLLEKLMKTVREFAEKEAEAKVYKASKARKRKDG